MYLSWVLVPNKQVIVKAAQQFIAEIILENMAFATKICLNSLKRFSFLC